MKYTMIRIAKDACWWRLALIFGVWCVTGCASLMSRSSYVVEIKSEPEGATVKIEEEHKKTKKQAVTPCQVKLPSHAGFARPAWYSMTFEKDGYYTEVRALRANLDNWFFGNLALCIVSCSFIGMAIVDPATGAMWRLDETVSVKLIPVE